MKVKKLLTLLVLSALLAGCSVTGSSESSQGGASSAGSDNTSQRDDSSSADDSSKSSAPDAATLVSISVTAPTKVAYTIGDEFSSDGLVVTATMSDGTTKTIESGFTLSTPDMSSAGTKTITVTYQDKTDTFEITVAKPTAWTAEERELFSSNLYGYVPTYFFGPDYDLGILEFSEGSSGNLVYAEGGRIDAPAEGQDSVMKPLVDLFVADGFALLGQPDAKNGVYHYLLEKDVTVEESTRCLQIRMTACDADGYFAAEGTFYLEIGDTFYYSWEETGFEALLKAGFEFESDIPDFPAGARFLKTVTNRIASLGIFQFTVCGIDDPYLESLLAAFSENQWVAFKSPRSGFDYDIVSPDASLRVGGSYNKTSKRLTVRVDEAPDVPTYVHQIASVFEIEGYGFAFNYSTQNDSYYYTFDEELGDGETLGSKLEEYTAILKGFQGSDFVIKGERKTMEEGKVVYETYYSANLGLLVSVFSYEEESKNYVQISVSKYVEIPALFAPAVALLGIDQNEYHVVAATQVSDAYIWVQLPVEEGTSDADGLKAFTDLIDADETLGYEVISPLAEVDMQGGGKGLHVVYANANTMIDMYVFSGTIQIAIEPYTPAPSTAWSDKVLETLAGLGFNLTWDSENYNYRYQDSRPLGEDEELSDVTSAIASALYSVEELGLVLLGSSLDAYESKVILCSNKSMNEGSIEISYSDGMYVDANRNPLTILDIKVVLYDKTVPYIINAIGSALGVSMAPVLDEETGDLLYYRSSYGYEYYGDAYSDLTQYGPTIMSIGPGAKLTGATSLGFKEVENGMGWAGNSLANTYANDDGYTVYLYLYGYTGKVYSGYYYVIVQLPSDADGE